MSNSVLFNIWSSSVIFLIVHIQLVTLFLFECNQKQDDEKDKIQVCCSSFKGLFSCLSVYQGHCSHAPPQTFCSCFSLGWETHLTVTDQHSSKVFTLLCELVFQSASTFCGTSTFRLTLVIRLHSSLGRHNNELLFIRSSPTLWTRYSSSLEQDRPHPQGCTYK